MKYTKSWLVRLVLPGFNPWVVQTILLSMHGMEDEGPHYVTSKNLFQIAMAAYFLDCRDILKLCVQKSLEYQSVILIYSSL
jgi:hypothetical protein